VRRTGPGRRIELVEEGPMTRSTALARSLVVPVLVVVAAIAAGCSPAGPTGAPSTSSGPGPTTGASASPAPGLASEPAATEGPGGGGAIPASCLDGFTAFLKLIEPVTAEYDPGTATLADYSDIDHAVSAKGIEAMDANGGRATYSCPEVGLEFAYFDSSSPWEAILELATVEAPGTFGYLATKHQESLLEVAELSDFSVATCDEAVSRIKDAVSGQMGAGTESVADMAISPGFEILGLYEAYLADVRDGDCPADQLGNDEFEFFGSFG
jgi:hypothetical protein